MWLIGKERPNLTIINLSNHWRMCDLQSWEEIKRSYKEQSQIWACKNLESDILKIYYQDKKKASWMQCYIYKKHEKSKVILSFT